MPGRAERLRAQVQVAALCLGLLAPLARADDPKPPPPPPPQVAPTGPAVKERMVTTAIARVGKRFMGRFLRGKELAEASGPVL